MSGTLFQLREAYDYGTKIFDAVLRGMLDGKPICCNADAGLLAQMIYNGKAGDHLEIGSAYGGSALIALKTMDHFGRDEKVVCIDPFGEERRDTLHKAVEKEFWRNIRHFGYIERIEHIKEFSHPFPIENREFSTALIDGDHAYEYVLNDWLNIKNIVNRFIMFHDYSRETVRDVVIEYAAQDEEWTLVAIHGWSAILKRKK